MLDRNFYIDLIAWRLYNVFEGDYMKCINIYKKEYVKYYNSVIDITKLIKDFLYPGKYSFSRINHRAPIKEQLIFIRKDLESLKFQKEIYPDFMDSLQSYYPINEEEIDERMLDELQVFINPLMNKIKSKLEHKYLPFVKRVEIDDFKDTGAEVYSDEQAWDAFLSDNDNLITLNRLFETMIHMFINEEKDEVINEYLRNHYSLEKIEFARYYKGENNTDSSIVRDAVINNRVNANFKYFDKVFSDIFGQDDAIAKIKRTLMRNILFYNAEDIDKRNVKPHGPLATFMFYGPTGTGKTETAKRMAQFIYGNDKKLLILDMNSYKDPKVSASALKGHPEGYVDSAKGTDFTRFLGQNDKGVIVLDEFEKADEEVRELFMTMLDEGSFKDALGNTYDLSGYVFIATTNVSKVFENRIRRIGFADFDKQEAKKSEESKIRDELRSLFTAPVLNRFNNIVGFNEISKEDATLICKDLISKLTSKIESKRFNGIVANVEISNIDEIVEIVLKESNFTKDGVRSLKNVINDIVGAPILEEIVNRNDKILLTAKNDEISVTKRKTNVKNSR